MKPTQVIRKFYHFLDNISYGDNFSEDDQPSNAQTAHPHKESTPEAILNQPTKSTELPLNQSHDKGKIPLYLNTPLHTKNIKNQTTLAF